MRYMRYQGRRVLRRRSNETARRQALLAAEGVNAMNALLAALLLLASILSPAEYHMARTIAGETGVNGACPREVKVLIAHMIGTGRSGAWYGDATPDAEALDVAHNWRSEPDPCPTARFLLSREDVESGVLADALGPEVGRWACANGYELRALEGRE